MMENYEEFCSRRLDGLHAETRCISRANHKGALSTIQFHRKHVLLPKLTEHQRLEMAEQRKKAVEKEQERRSLSSRSVLACVQDILSHIQLQKKQDVANDKVGQDADSSPLVSQAPPSKTTHPDRHPSPDGLVPFCSSSTLRRETLRLLNSRMERTGIGSEEWGEEQRTSGAMTAQSNKETEETLSRKANVKGSVPECPLVAESADHFTSAYLSCSVDSLSPDSLLASLSLCASLTGSYAKLPSPQPSCSPPVQCSQRPHPASTGHILIAVPVSESELSPHRLNGTSVAWSESHPSESPSSRITVQVEQSDSSECLTTSPSGGEWNCSYSELSSNRLSSVSTSTPRSSTNVTTRRHVSVPHATPHTQVVPTLQREKSRQHNSTPYQRSPPAPLNQSYDVESPSLSLPRPEVNSGSEFFTASVQRKQALGVWPQHPLEDRMTLGFLAAQDKALGRNIQVLEALDQRLEEEHAHRLSHLLREQETQHLQQEVFMEQHRAVCRLTAVARGFLTRRLLQTEKVKHLRKTIQDSRELIHSFQADAQQRRASFTTQDLCLQRRVRAQLRTALRKVHEIFFVWLVRDKLVLLQQNRELHNERRLREMEKGKSPCVRHTLSFGTQKSLDRRSQGKKVPQKTKIPQERALQPTQGQTAVISSQKFKAARVVRRTVEKLHISLLTSPHTEVHLDLLNRSKLDTVYTDV